MNLVDTSGWIEFFFGGPNANIFSKPIEDTENLLVSVICIYEVFKKIRSTVDEARALQAIGQMKLGLVLDLTEEIALKAALASCKHKLPMADSMIYATALDRNAIIWTQDEHFKKLPQVKFIKRRP